MGDAPTPAGLRSNRHWGENRAACLGRLAGVALIAASPPASALVKRIAFETRAAGANGESPLNVGDGVAIAGVVDGSLGQEQFFHEVGFTLDRDAGLALTATWVQPPPFANTLGYALRKPDGLAGVATPSPVPMDRTTTATLAASFANPRSGDYTLLSGGTFVEDVATCDARLRITPIPGAAALLGTAVAGPGLVARRRHRLTV